MKNIKTASFPEWRGIVDELAFKTITRVVSDGQPLKLAIREAIKIGELNKQDIFYLLSRLQDFGMVHNGDPKNYWATGLGEGIGEDSIETVPGTNYYAAANGKIRTAELKKESELFELFASVDSLRESGISDEDIVRANPDMQTVLDIMQDFDLYETADMADQALTKTAMPVDSENPISTFTNLVFKAYKAFQSKKFSTFEEAMQSVAKQSNLEPSTNLKRMVDLVRKNNPEIPEYSSEDTGMVHEYSKDERIMKPLAERAKKLSKIRGISFKDAFDTLSNDQYPSPDWSKLVEWAGLGSFNPNDVVTASYENLFRRTAQAAPAPVAPVEPAAAAPAPEGGDEMSGLDEALSDAGPDDGPEVSEDISVGGDDQVNVEVTPTPSELTDLAQNGPEWDVKNMLSLTKAQKYYESLKESLEAVVYNENLKMDLDSVAKYDKVRAAIDTELEKIDEAVKGKKKIENKEMELEEQVEEGPEVTEEPMDVMETPPASPAPVEEAEVTE
jgi:hypothetical protein